MVCKVPLLSEEMPIWVLMCVFLHKSLKLTVSVSKDDAFQLLTNHENYFTVLFSLLSDKVLSNLDPHLILCFHRK